MNSNLKREVQFDNERKLVSGPDFTLKHEAQRADEPYLDIFIYEDSELKTCVSASRKTFDEKQRYWADARIYTIETIGIPYLERPGMLTWRDIPSEKLDRIVDRLKVGLLYDQSPFYRLSCLGVTVKLRHPNRKGSTPQPGWKTKARRLLRFR